MNSLVPDYEDSSSSSDSERSDDEEATPEPEYPMVLSEEDSVSKLPKPNFDNSTSSKNSVFNNPFVEAENAKKAILEKHVKMVQPKDKVQTINGKKICWNYRKGRCRFGHTCTFAHDTDLYKNKDTEDEADKNNTKAASGSNQNISESFNGMDPQDGKRSNKKKRPGLGDNVIPSKKVMKFYKHNKLKPN